jgi:8-oxo-dGTP diphosphatase
MVEGPGRHRAGVILVVEDRLAVIDRFRPGVGRYQVLPGGGVGEGETLAETAVREVLEQTGLRVEVGVRPSLCLSRGVDREWLFYATVTGGVFGGGRGRELTGPRPARGTYEPRLVPRADLGGLNLGPAAVAEVVLRAWSTGEWWDPPTRLEDPSVLDPIRVRAGAIIIRDSHVLLVGCGGEDQAGKRCYEFPGGDVEPGETPVAAITRKLAEETGLVASTVREVAVVFTDGRREHYHAVAAAGPEADWSGLDLSGDARPVWCPLGDLAGAAVRPKRLAWRVVRWDEVGWPDAPVVLSDSIVDLDEVCTW